MKKFGKYFVVAMIVVAATAAVLVGCKKDEQTSGKQEKSVSEYDETQQPSESEEKIISFINDYEGMKKGKKADGEAVSLEEARWQWETTLNYCYGFTQSLLSDMRQDTVYVDLPQPDGSGMMAYNDVIATYDAIVNEVRKAYSLIDLEGKTLKFVMMNLVDGTAKDGGSKAEVIVNTGSSDTSTGRTEPGPWYGIPFNDGICWKWGENMGPCNTSYFIPSDAARQITEKFACYDERHSLIYNPCPDCYTYILNPHVEYSVSGNSVNDWLFHAEGLTEDEVMNYCLCEDELNYYYAQSMMYTHTPDMIINPYGYESYYYMEMKSGHLGLSSIGLFNIFHYLVVYYAERQWRHHADDPYPTPIDDPGSSSTDNPNGE